MGWYDDRLLPHIITLACGVKPVRMQREKIVPQATGDVLEIGFGNGPNLPYYNRSNIRKVWGLEPSEGMRKLAAAPIAASGMDVELIDLPGEEIPLQAGSVDTVLVTYTLCTIPEVGPTLEGIRRVLKAGGQLLFCEHGCAPDPGVRRWQDKLNTGWGRVAGGCNMNRDIPYIIESAGFSIIDDNRMYIPGLRILSYNFWGAAVVR